MVITKVSSPLARSRDAMISPCLFGLPPSPRFPGNKEEKLKTSKEPNFHNLSLSFPHLKSLPVVSPALSPPRNPLYQVLLVQYPPEYQSPMDLLHFVSPRDAPRPDGNRELQRVESLAQNISKASRVF